MSQEDLLEWLADIFEAHKKRLFRYIRHLVMRMNLGAADTADDILGETALVACQKAVRSPNSVPSDPQALVAWLMRMALFICLNHYRKAKTQRKALAEYENIMQEHELMNVIEEDPPQLRREVHTFLETLNVREHELLDLYLREGLTSGEIGQRLGMEAATVRKIKERILGRLHAYLTR